MRFRLYIFLIPLLLLCPLASSALSLEQYAEHSRLATGRWIKVSIPSTGVYAITKSQLQKWGFSDASRVRIYGYGGHRIGDALTAANYIDDLPLVQTLSTEQGIIFYGVGPEDWKATSTGGYDNNSNIYSQAGYYFLTEGSEDERPVEIVQNALSGQMATQYVDRLHYELDRVSMGEAGWMLVGESLRSGSVQLQFDTPDAISAVLECAVVSQNASTGTIELIVDGNKLSANPSDNIGVMQSSTYTHGICTVSSHEIENLTGPSTLVAISVKGANAMQECRLEYASLAVTRALKMKPQGHMSIWLTNQSAQLQTAGMSDIHVWDVSDPANILAMQLHQQSDGSVAWTNVILGNRSYVAFSAQASLPSPDFVALVPNQDLHSTPCTNMVIMALPEYLTQAQRIAQLHANAAMPLSVTVLNVNEVYNEFGSGAPDVSALRKCLKMLYDRGNASDSLDRLQYALLLGRATYDNRHLTAQYDGMSSYNTIPVWMGGERKLQLSDNTGFGTDDFIAMLEDYSGTNMGLDELSIAVGRIPARNVDELKSNIDKLAQYMQKSRPGVWKNSFVFLADDGDNGIHARQTEKIISAMEATPLAQNLISKVYVDAYDIIGGSCEGGRQDMYRLLQEGVVWWNFCGHANNHSWTSENMLNYNDINNLYLTHVPVLMAATCDFLRWDSSTLSGGEILFNHRYGGNIATISATRPVYITDNGYFTHAIGRAINARDAQGRLPRLGDIYRNAKNNILNDAGERRSNTNRLRYVLMGDPALQLAMPSNIVTLDSIGDAQVDPEAQITLKALQRVALKGSVRTSQGQVIDDFNGVAMVNIYDAERSTTTQGKRDDNVVFSFEQHGNLLFSGSASVSNGHFTLNVAMPGEVADNFRPASANMYAYAADGRDAAGLNKDFYVYGLDESAPLDDIAPSINGMWLNRTDFASGDVVNDTPMLIADISDDVGINLSAAGIGHNMTITVDDKHAYTDVSLYYTPSTDGTPSGQINYPLAQLTSGEHKLRLRIWDTSLNSAESEIYFSVNPDQAPTITDVYADANPASIETNFYVLHDRPDSQISVTISVYNLLGRLVWEGEASGRSDMFASTPVNWNLCDMAGRRVPRGIYVYRATIRTADGDRHDTASKKIAVTAPN